MRKKKLIAEEKSSSHIYFPILKKSIETKKKNLFVILILVCVFPTGWSDKKWNL